VRKGERKMTGRNGDMVREEDRIWEGRVTEEDKKGGMKRDGQGLGRTERERKKR
jgi:hypothetical protein